MSISKKYQVIPIVTMTTFNNQILPARRVLKCKEILENSQKTTQYCTTVVQHSSTLSRNPHKYAIHMFHNRKQQTQFFKLCMQLAGKAPKNTFFAINCGLCERHACVEYLLGLMGRTLLWVSTGKDGMDGILT